MSDLQHIKDAYYFEIPKALWRSQRETREEFPEHYVRLDPDYQDWEASRQYDGLAKLEGLNNVPPKGELLAKYHAWRSAHGNFAKPFDRFLEEAPSQGWFQRQLGLGGFPDKILAELEAKQLAQIPPLKAAGKLAAKEHAEAVKQARADARAEWAGLMDKAGSYRKAWDGVKAQAEDLDAYMLETPAWPAAKIEQYNQFLDGKILIPQPFGKLKNNYEAESGFCISKFMVLQLVVAGLLLLVFRRLAARSTGARPVRGKLWNLFEMFLMFIRDQIARPAIGEHDADRYVPLLWTMFMFVLTCNLFGMLPWVGAPTGSFSVTVALALVTFATVVIGGSKKYGVVGFWTGQVPHMDLPFVLAIFIKPMLFVIEVVGLLIKHLVLGIRLLANMVAGHLVLLAIMGIAVKAAATSMWPAAAGVSVAGSALFSLLELFVAFLQAYVFTFLSALFIGASIHQH